MCVCPQWRTAAASVDKLRRTSCPPKHITDFANTPSSISQPCFEEEEAAWKRKNQGSMSSKHQAAGAGSRQQRQAAGGR